MQNIPTELLRTLIAVVDHRSFTKAAISLGVTQPAVSSQIKRLQQLLGGELFDRSAPGVTLAEKGVRVVTYARRLLAINDQIYGLAVQQDSESVIRVAIPIDVYNRSKLFELFSDFRRREPNLKLQITADYSDMQRRAMQEGLFEIALTRTDGDAEGARHSWAEDLVWMGFNEESLNRGGRVPLIVLGDSVGRRLGIAALEQAGLNYDLVFIAKTWGGMVAATRADFGVCVGASRFIQNVGLAHCRSSSWLPGVPDVRAAIYVRNEPRRAAVDRLADEMAAALSTGERGQPEPAASQR